ncbi:hypothetical protein BGZ76_003360 [Entomortierella beljakovae]|nr:hypothetical protein BGZ76_003360 [Entomortierella beljakovae]
MPKYPALCTKDYCENAVDQTQHHTPPQDDPIHIAEYHGECQEFKNYICLLLTFARENITWSFRCACDGLYKPVQSFKRHTKQCPDMLNTIQEAFNQKKRIKTDFFEIVPRSLEEGAKNTQEQYNELLTTNNILMSQLLHEVSESRREARAESEAHQNILMGIQSQLQAQTRLLKATNDLVLLARKSEQESFKNGKRAASSKSCY